jgi:pimeloyl-ACP methyl ester carboxylesterase
VTNPALAAHWRSMFVPKSAFPAFDFRGELAKVTSPVLIIGGDEDPVMPPPFQDELEAGLTRAPVRRIRLSKAGHFLHIDAPDAYFAALREFVA